MRIIQSPRTRASLVGLAALTLQLSALTAQTTTTQPTLRVLYTFDRAGTPNALVEVKPGEFLGIADIGNEIFSVTARGKYQDVYDFPPAGNTVVGLTQALNGRTYGGASNSGPVTTFSELFAVGPGGKLTTHSYNGSTQGGPNILVQSPDNYLYTTFGIVGGSQMFSRVDYSGNFNTLYTFGPGFPAYATTFLGQSGDFYGVWQPSNTTAGIYSISTAGSFSWIVPPFASGGNNNQAFGLIQASNGNLYGTLPQSGSAGAGTIYEAKLDGTMQTIYQFPNRELGIPDGLLEASDGKLYGMAEGQYLSGYDGYSSIFRIDPHTRQFETVFALKNAQFGECVCRLIQGSDGKLYGVASGGGLYNAGTVFALDAGLPPPKPRIRSFGPASGTVGQKVLLWGRAMLGATAVSFNGTPATKFTVASSQGVWAEVPSGATSGPITITTPNGSFTTTESFTVE